MTGNDITKTGKKTQKQLREENDARTLNSINYAANRNALTVRGFRTNLGNAAVQSTPRLSRIDEIGLERSLGVGDSRYDDAIMNIPVEQLTPEDVQNNRAEQQSGIAKLGAGLAKAGVLASTTFADTFAGTLGGILNVGAGIVSGNIDSFGGALTAFVKNPVSEWLQSVNDASEDIFKNYYTSDEEEKAWYQNAFGAGAANFWGDHFLKNVGFFAGAYLSGKAVAGGMSKLMKMDKARDIFRGAAMSEGLEGATSKDVLKAFASGDAVMGTEMVSNALANAARDLKNKELKVKIASALSGSIGESRMEAIQNSNDYYNKQAEELERRRQDELLKIVGEPEANGYFGDVPGPDGKYYRTVTKPNDLAMYRARREAEINEKYDKLKAELGRETNNYANISFGMNMIVTSLDNFAVFGDAMVGGYSSARRMANLVKRNKKGAYVPSRMEQLKTLGKGLMAPVYEGEQEMAQEAITKSLNKYEGSKLNRLADDTISKEGLESTTSYLRDFLNASGEVHTSPDDWENFALGFLTALLPLPVRGVSVNDKGEKVSKFNLSGELYDSIREYRDIKKEASSAADALNNIVSDENFVNSLRQAIINNHLEDIKTDAAESGDIFRYKNAEVDKVINNAISFENAGRFDDYINTLESAFTVKNVDELRSMATMTENSEDGKDASVSMYDGLSDREILDYFEKTKEQYIETAKKTVDAYRNMNYLYGENVSQAVKTEMARSIVAIDDREKRIKSISDDISKMLIDASPSDKVAELQDKINDIGSLRFFIDSGNSVVKSHFEELKRLYDEQKRLKDLMEKKLGYKEEFNAIKTKINEQSESGTIDKELVERLKVLEDNIENAEKNGITSAELDKVSDSIKSVTSMNPVDANKVSELKNLILDRENLIRTLAILSSKEYLDSGLADVWIGKDIVKAVKDIVESKVHEMYEPFMSSFDDKILENNQFDIDSIINVAKNNKSEIDEALASKYKEIFDVLKNSNSPKDIVDAVKGELSSLFADIRRSGVPNDTDVRKYVDKTVKEFVNNSVSYIKSVIDDIDSGADVVSAIEDNEGDDDHVSLDALIDMFSDGDNDISKSIKDYMSVLKDISESMKKVRVKSADNDSNDNSTDNDNTADSEDDDNDDGEVNFEEDGSSDNGDKDEDEDPDDEQGGTADEEVVNNEGKGDGVERGGDIKINNNDKPSKDDVKDIVAHSLEVTETDKNMYPKGKSELPIGKPEGYTNGKHVLGQLNVKYGKNDDQGHVGRRTPKYAVNKDSNDVIEYTPERPFMKKIYDFLYKKSGGENRNSVQHLFDSGDMNRLMTVYRETHNGNDMPLDVLIWSNVVEAGEKSNVESAALESTPILAINVTELKNDPDLLGVEYKDLNGILDKYKYSSKGFTKAKVADINNTNYNESSTNEYIILGPYSGNKNNPTSDSSYKLITDKCKTYSKVVKSKRMDAYKNRGDNMYAGAYSFCKVPGIRMEASMMFSGRIEIGKKQVDLKDVTRKYDKVLKPDEHFAIRVYTGKNANNSFTWGMNFDEDELVTLNNYFAGLSSESNSNVRSNTVWLITREADGMLYHKGVAPKTFNRKFVEDNSDSPFAIAINHIVEGMVKNHKDDNMVGVKDSLQQLRSILYMYDKHPIYAVTTKSGDNGFIVKTGRGEVYISANDENATNKMIGELTKKQCKFIITDRGLETVRSLSKFKGTDLELIVNGNILSTNLGQLHNYNSSLAVKPVKESNGEIVPMYSQYEETFSPKKSFFYVPGDTKERRVHIHGNAVEKILGFKSDGWFTFKSVKKGSGSKQFVVHKLFYTKDGKEVEADYSLLKLMYSQYRMESAKPDDVFFSEKFAKIYKIKGGKDQIYVYGDGNLVSDNVVSSVMKFKKKFKNAKFSTKEKGISKDEVEKRKKLYSEKVGLLKRIQILVNTDSRNNDYIFARGSKSNPLMVVDNADDVLFEYNGKKYKFGSSMSMTDLRKISGLQKDTKELLNSVKSFEELFKKEGGANAMRDIARQLGFVVNDIPMTYGMIAGSRNGVVFVAAIRNASTIWSVNGLTDNAMKRYEEIVDISKNGNVIKVENVQRSDSSSNDDDVVVATKKKDVKQVERTKKPDTPKTDKKDNGGSDGTPKQNVEVKPTVRNPESIDESDINNLITKVESMIGNADISVTIGSISINRKKPLILTLRRNLMGLLATNKKAIYDAINGINDNLTGDEYAQKVADAINNANSATKNTSDCAL